MDLLKTVSSFTEYSDMEIVGIFDKLNFQYAKHPELALENAELLVAFSAGLIDTLMQGLPPTLQKSLEGLLSASSKSLLKNKMGGTRRQKNRQTGGGGAGSPNSRELIVVPSGQLQKVQEQIVKAVEKGDMNRAAIIQLRVVSQVYMMQGDIGKARDINLEIERMEEEERSIAELVPLSYYWTIPSSGVLGLGTINLFIAIITTPGSVAGGILGGLGAAVTNAGSGSWNIFASAWDKVSGANSTRSEGVALKDGIQAGAQAGQEILRAFGTQQQYISILFFFILVWFFIMYLSINFINAGRRRERGTIRGVSSTGNSILMDATASYGMAMNAMNRGNNLLSAPLVPMQQLAPPVRKSYQLISNKNTTAKARSESKVPSLTNRQESNVPSLMNRPVSSALTN